ncbi:MAG: LPS assembly lipoprotein LptE [Granulosicoccus sp.]
MNQFSSVLRTGRVGILCFALSLVTACGFHPRGSVTRLSDLGSIYIDSSRNLTIADDIREALVDAAFTIAPNRDEADIMLRLTGEEQKERVVSVRSTGRVSELELSHAVDMLIAESIDGKEPVYAQSQSLNRVEVIREYTYDEKGVLGKENEARILRSEMKSELVRQIVLRTIASLAPSISSVTVDQSGWQIAALDVPDTIDNLIR